MKELIKFLLPRFLLLGGVTAVGLSLVMPEQMVAVNVRWSAGVTDAQRANLERRFSLNDPQFSEGTTWRYSLRDFSPENIRALVQDEHVGDTHHIDRARFLPDEPPPGRIRRIAPAALLAGGIGALLLLAARALARKNVYLPQRTVAAIVAVAPILLLIATIITLVLAALGR